MDLFAQFVKWAEPRRNANGDAAIRPMHNE
jgi:hypothetical protein